MATAIESARRDPVRNHQDDIMGARTVPIITSTPTPTIKMSAPSPAGEPMEITSPNYAPHATSSNSSPQGENHDAVQRQNNSNDHSNSTSMPAPAVAAAAVHQPKIVQTAFIHKLYNMLEDPNIQHLISWSSSAESFVMSPSHDFSKVLAQYFKHTNISSFVRQLNMYGFHKVSDVFHTGNPETALWEFKHGNGNFKRGDLVGLREIKRRASRHALVHREPYNSQKPTPSQPGTPAEPMPPMPDGSDPRLASIEHNLYEVNARLQRSEENAHYMYIKQQAMMDTVTRLLHFNQELSRTVLSLVPNPNDQIHRDVLALQGEIQRQSDLFRSMDEPHEPPLSGSRQYFANLDNPPVSPRQLGQDDQRRLNVPQSRGGNFYRPPVPSNLSINARRSYGSIGGNTVQSSSPLRTQAPPPPAGPPHPLANVEPPPGSLARRHTSADIRAHGWQPAPSPFAGSGPPSSQWPSSPSRVPQDDQRLHESLSTYSLQSASQQSHSRPSTPPPPPFSNGINGMDSFNSWSWSSAGRENKNLSIKDSSGPPTRRGSMAHILNPTDTAEQPDEDDPRGDDDRKRKRIQ
ncbi:HSF-type DNA-binding-domain-containing protein [Pseudomassariella vexata]|uniref:HSF-type DNA-binding-domain-containing protein n=1 Tax=Pseudomassariella vexata TaxID=1141098 RepID=A0A1Y2DZ91_9PEZI|nr:HSF-type DNA-binding-domain-containing protein [Pseudomassariella vexata]ORY64414.1 HSF-type DNA-binding-domain-containing protein [Pseudomassariella vexata]